MLVCSSIMLISLTCCVVGIDVVCVALLLTLVYVSMLLFMVLELRFFLLFFVGVGVYGGGCDVVFWLVVLRVCWCVWYGLLCWC